MTGRSGAALAELLVSLAILGVGSAGAMSLFTLAHLEMERAEIAQRAFLLASDLTRGGGSAPPLTVSGGLLAASGEGSVIRVRYEPQDAGGTGPRHPPREWSFDAEAPP